MVRILSLIDTDVTPRQVYQILLEEAQAVVLADDGGAARYDQERQLMHPAFPMSMESCTVVDKRLMVAVAAAERCALIENDYQRTMGRNTPAGRIGAQAVLAVPLVHDDALVGSASISHLKSGHRFKPRDARSFEALASAAATVISGIERQRTTGARMAMREAAHLLNNDLTLTMGSLDVLRTADDLAPQLGSLVETALDGVTQAAAHLAQLQTMTHFPGRNGQPGPRLEIIHPTRQDAAV
jgi:GAF domain-containing protein